MFIIYLNIITISLKKDPKRIIIVNVWLKNFVRIWEQRSQLIIQENWKLRNYYIFIVVNSFKLIINCCKLLIKKSLTSTNNHKIEFNVQWFHGKLRWLFRFLLKVKFINLSNNMTFYDFFTINKLIFFSFYFLFLKNENIAMISDFPDHTKK